MTKQEMSQLEMDIRRDVSLLKTIAEKQLTLLGNCLEAGSGFSQCVSLLMDELVYISLSCDDAKRILDSSLVSELADIEYDLTPETD